MLKVWDGSDWKNLDGVKYWTGTAWDSNNKSKVRSAKNDWLPPKGSDTDTSVIVKWNVGPRTPEDTPEQKYQIPNLIGLTYSQAVTAIQNANFNVGDLTFVTTTILGSDEKVSSQYPQPGLLFPENTFINISIYEYKIPTVTMPNLNGLLKSAAEQTITSLGLVVGTLDTIEVYDTSLIGRVVANVQYPLPGATVDVGTLVTFDYYIQKPFATMPQLVGQDEFSVFSLLNAVGLDSGTRTTIETTNKALEGKVESQQYNAGQQLQQGTTVNYRVYIPNVNTTVPNIVGKTPAQADSLLQASELYLGSQTTLETTNVSLEGTIASQQYGVGTVRPVNTSVNYVVYIPNTTTTVPNITNQTTSVATSLLASAELQLGYKTGETETSNTSLHNKIYTQSPSSGQVVPVNSSVNYTLYVPLKTGTIPNIVGQTPSVASSTLTSAGFSLGYQTGTTYTNNQVDVGKIVTQSPASGTTQNLGSSVNYTTYVLNPNVTVPNIVGLSFTAANTALTNAGLNVGTVTETPTFTSTDVGKVQSQGTAAGSSVARGSSVNYVKWRAYISNTSTVTKTGTAYVWSPTWQSTYYGSGSTSGSGARRTINPESLYFGKFSSTSTTGDQVSLIRVSDSALSTACNAVSGNRPYTITGVTFNFGVQTGVGNSSKPVYFGYYNATGSQPSSISISGVTKNAQNAGTLTNGNYYSINLNSTMRNYCFNSPNWALVVNAASDAASSYGALKSDSTYFTISLSWQESTVTYT